MRTFITSLLVLFLCDILAYPGIITTVAGCDDIGPFKAPTAVTVDRQGNLYIADQEAYRIYKVDAVSGERRSIVGTGISGCPHNGNIATKSELSAPVSLAIDSAGSLYISDQSCEMVYKVDGESGIITELAGNGRCWTYQDQAPHRLGIALCEPSGITLDHKGNLYIADRGNSIIRKVNLRTSQATIEAGIHRIWGFSGDSGLATEAELHEPEAVAVDSLGNLYIADS